MQAASAPHMHAGGNWAAAVAEAAAGMVAALQREEDVCTNATYTNRIDDPEAYNFCVVPDSGSDAVVFVAVALLLTCLIKGQFAMLFVLISGMLLELLVFYVNTYQLGNSFSLWLGIQPADTFLYVFLPALLLESSCRLDFFLFKKFIVQIMVLAFLCVLINTVLLTPVLLYGFNLANDGWAWQHAVLFSAMVASTDAVSVTAVLHSAGAPEALVVLLEGESLFNDATSIVLFEIFFDKVKDLDMGKAAQVELVPELLSIGYQICVLAGGGIVVGLAFGYLTLFVLRWLRKGSLAPKAEISFVLGMAYVCYYVANGPLKVSGVIAVVVMGLQGGSTGKWELSSKVLESGQFDHFWDILGFVLNGVVFFFAGAASVNFLLRSGGVVFTFGLKPLLVFFSTLPLIYIAIFVIRLLGMVLVSPLLKVLGASLSAKTCTFATFGGLRGALCLILVQNMIQSNIQLGELPDTVLEVRGEIALWASGFVLMTLLINAPLLGGVLTALGLDEVSVSRKLIRGKAQRALKRFTDQAIESLRKDDDEMLRGTDWDAVEEYVCGSAGAPSESSDTGSFSHGESVGLGGGRTLDPRHSKTVARMKRAGDTAGSGSSASLSEALLADGQQESADCYRTVGPSAAIDLTSAPWSSGAEVLDDDASFQDDGEAMFHAFRRTGKLKHEELEELQPGAHSHSEPQTPAPGTSQRAGKDGPSGTAEFFDIKLPDEKALHGRRKSVELEAHADQQLRLAGRRASLLAAGNSGRAIMQRQPSLTSATSRESMVKIPVETLAEEDSPFGVGDDDEPSPFDEAEDSEAEPSVTRDPAPSSSGGAGLSRRLSSLYGLFSSTATSQASLDEAASEASNPAPPADEENAMPRFVSVHNAGHWTNLANQLQRTVSTRAPSPQKAAASPSASGGVTAGVSWGGTTLQSPLESEAPEEPEDSTEIETEKRIRVLMGMKRYFHAKRREGLLSSHGLRILNEAVDLSLDRPERKLSVWKIAEKEACGKFYARMLGSLAFHLRRLRISYKIPVLSFLFNGVIIDPVIQYISTQMSYVMTLACEVAIEYWLSLRYSPNAAWLATAAPQLMDEIEEEMDKVWQFIIDREVEAPERFRMVQSYRAAMAILRQQKAFVEKLYASGMVDEGEMHHMMEHIQERQLKLEQQGPGWKQPTVSSIVRGLPFFKNIDQEAFLWIRRHSMLLRFKQGDTVLRQDNAGSGMYIVINGMVESKYKEIMPGFNNVWMVGTGGVIGLNTSLTKIKVPGAADVIACGNPLGKGPVLFHIPQEAVDEIRRRATEGAVAFQQLEINLFRLSALNYVERLRPMLVEQLCQRMLAVQEAAAKREQEQAKPKGKSKWSKVKDKVFEEMLEQEHGRVRPNSRAAELAKNLKSATELHMAAHRILDEVCDALHEGRLADLKAGDDLSMGCSCVLLAGTLLGPIEGRKKNLPVIRGPYVFLHSATQGSQAVHRYSAGAQGAIAIMAGPDTRLPSRTVASKHLKEIVAPH